MKLHSYETPVKEMVERYQQLYTAAINDVFQERDMHHQWLGPDIKCCTVELRSEVVAGFAFTLQWILDPLPDERERPAAKMVASYPEDSIIIVDAGNDQTSGFWGELATTVCMGNGVNGAVINGGAKDTGFVKMMGFPIFCRFTSPVDGFFRSRLRDWQIPIWFNDVLIRPGDFVVGDSDGVLIIPQEIAEDVLEETERRAENESDTRRLLKEGVSPEEASRLTGRKDL
ncbi:MAG: RraA family protein [Anaerolineae bacterium]|nr:MAG: RraA family protein [Anaerolineae bacterium]